MKVRTWINVITVILLALVVFFSWDEIVQAWNLLGQVNLWILALLIPIQIMSYYAAGEITFSYLRNKGEIKKVGRWKMTRIALELNFVNHILPSGGAAGFSYITWVLSKYGVRSGRSVMSQIVRFALMFFSFAVLIAFSVIFLALTGGINQTVLIFSSVIIFAVLIATIVVVWLIGNEKRLLKVTRWITRVVNKIVAAVTRGKKSKVLVPQQVNDFSDNIFKDFQSIKRDYKTVLKKPFIWAFVANILDMLLLFTAFWSLGYIVNPALLFIGLGLSSICGIFFLTPGGVGVYETIMITFLASAGVPADMAIAGTLLARVILLLGTILFGYLFYQQTLRTHGRKPQK